MQMETAGRSSDAHRRQTDARSCDATVIRAETRSPALSGTPAISPRPAREPASAFHGNLDRLGLPPRTLDEAEKLLREPFRLHSGSDAAPRGVPARHKRLEYPAELSVRMRRRPMTDFRGPDGPPAAAPCATVVL